jgi:hypothetical protein
MRVPFIVFRLAGAALVAVAVIRVSRRDRWPLPVAKA